MTQPIDPRIQEALDAIRQRRELAFQLAEELGLPRVAGYRIMSRLGVMTEEHARQRDLEAQAQVDAEHGYDRGSY